MGWRLAEEVAWARPERPGAEWWTLLDIAQDANDDTRRGWPGRDYLAARAKKSPRTIDRYVDKLIEDGFLVCIKRAAPGRRPVYELALLFEISTTCDTEDDARTSDTIDGARSDSQNAEVIHNVRQNGGQRATKNGQRATPTVSHPPSILPSLLPSIAKAVDGDVSTPVDGELSTSARSSIEISAWQAVREGTA
jgi:hypothetical protein